MSTQTLVNHCSAQALSDSGSQALGALISKFRDFKDIGFETFTKLFNSGVKPILTFIFNIHKTF